MEVDRMFVAAFTNVPVMDETGQPRGYDEVTPANVIERATVPANSLDEAADLIDAFALELAFSDDDDAREYRGVVLAEIDATTGRLVNATGRNL